MWLVSEQRGGRFVLAKIGTVGLHGSDDIEGRVSYAAHPVGNTYFRAFVLFIRPSIQPSLVYLRCSANTLHIHEASEEPTGRLIFFSSQPNMITIKIRLPRVVSLVCRCHQHLKVSGIKRGWFEFALCKQEVICLGVEGANSAVIVIFNLLLCHHQRLWCSLYYSNDTKV